MATLLSVVVFLGVGALFVFVNLALGRMIRPRLRVPEKAAAYECGEEPSGASWVQFDLRFYIVALLFLVFDVEVALFYPWAAIFHDHKLAGLLDLLPFFAIPLVGYAYLWRFGYLDWVRSHPGTTAAASSGQNSHSALPPHGQPQRPVESVSNP